MLKENTWKYCTKITWAIRLSNFVYLPIFCQPQPPHLPPPLAQSNGHSSSGFGDAKTFGFFRKLPSVQMTPNPEIPEIPWLLDEVHEGLGNFFCPHSSLRLRSLLNPNRTSFTNIYYLYLFVTWCCIHTMILKSHEITTTNHFHFLSFTSNSPSKSTGFWPPPRSLRECLSLRRRTWRKDRSLELEVPSMSTWGI